MTDADPRDYIYDLESNANLFCATVKHVATGTRWIFEISIRFNHSMQLVSFLTYLRSSGARMVGFNVIGYDYPMLHHFLALCRQQGYATAEQMHWKNVQIISGGDDRFSHTIWPSDRFVPQLDLYLIHHFDNQAKRTSLKVLEFNMQSHTIEDLPFDPNVPLQPDQFPIVIRYNAHDVNETEKFYFHSLPMIKFRDELTVRYGEDFTNYNDTKIGKQYFIMELEKALPGSCFDRSSGRKEPRQTFRRSIPIADLVFPYVRFHHPEFARVLNYLKAVTLTNTNKPEEFKDLTAEVGGLTYYFGAGGMHASLTAATVRADDDHELIDVDVASYYPNLAIKNRIYPEHLSEKFCNIYEELYIRRKGYPKKSSESAMLKLALNGVYGDSNNVYSPFYDPAYTMAITINGQLLLCMLAEWLIESRHIQVIQANTDGLTVRCHRDGREWFDKCYDAWQFMTLLELETTKYSAMFIRDVNNYMAVGTDGKIKRIGAYAHETQAANPATRELWWNKDWSSRVIALAVEAVLVRGENLTEFINRHDDPFDFMIRVKVPRSSRLVAKHTDGQTEPLQNTSRYCIAPSGPYLFKVMPPLAKNVVQGKDAERWMAVDKGWPVRVCNVISDFDWHHLDRTYYIKEAEKLLGMQ